MIVLSLALIMASIAVSDLIRNFPWTTPLIVAGALLIGALVMDSPL